MSFETMIRHHLPAPFGGGGGEKGKGVFWHVLQLYLIDLKT
jgi:hypothetical protein